MAFERGYYEIRFNLSREQANRSILADCAKVYDAAIADGKSEAEAFEIRRVKAVELDAYWFTWRSY